MEEHIAESEEEMEEERDESDDEQTSSDGGLHTLSGKCILNMPLPRKWQSNTIRIGVGIGGARRACAP